MGVSAAVLGASRLIAGAVSIGGRKSRLTDKEMPQLIALVCRGAAEISRGPGYDGNGLVVRSLEEVGVMSR